MPFCLEKWAYIVLLAKKGNNEDLVNKSITLKVINRGLEKINKWGGIYMSPKSTYMCAYKLRVQKYENNVPMHYKKILTHSLALFLM